VYRFMGMECCKRGNQLVYIGGEWVDLTYATGSDLAGIPLIGRIIGAPPSSCDVPGNVARTSP